MNGNPVVLNIRLNESF